ncbi:MAG: GNAT family N-acetyltransferase [Oscillospiraceae bacterium]
MREILRSSLPGDEPALKRIWHTVFGDNMDYIDAFFERVYSPSSALLMEVDGNIASAVYILPIGSLKLPGGETYPCTVSYAFATLPAFRSRGYGALIAKAAVEKTFSDGFSAATICPAEDSLFNYYTEKVGYGDYFYSDEHVYTAFDSAAKGKIRAAAASEYSEMRENLLNSRAHIAFDKKYIEYQEFLCSRSGGLFAIESDAGIGCCAAEKMPDGSVLVKELLTPDIRADDAVSLLQRAIPAGKYIVRSPAIGTGRGLRFAMLYVKEVPELPAGSSAPWYGFAFD